MIRDLQHRHEIWSVKNFGHKPRPSSHPLMGIGEEYGELLHHFLKREQGIRMEEDHEFEIKDSLADIFIYMLDFANREGIDLETVILNTIDYVHRRDWVKYPNSGGFPPQPVMTHGANPPNVGVDGTSGIQLPVNQNEQEGEPWPIGKKTSGS